MNNTLRQICLLSLLAVLPVTARAQDSTRKDAWLSTFSVGFPSFEGDMALMLFTVGGNFTKIRPGALAPDFSIGTMPYALSAGLLPIAGRAGLALPMQTSSGMLLLPSAGFSAILVSASGGGGALAGKNVGFAMASKTGSRVGITWHRFGEGETIMLLEIGVGRIR